MCAMEYISDLVNSRSQSQAPATSAKTVAEATNGAPTTRAAPSVSSGPDGGPVASQSSRKKARLGSGEGEGEDEPDASAQIVSVCRRLGLTTPRIEVTPVCSLHFSSHPSSFYPLIPAHQYIPTTTNHTQHEIHGYFDARSVFPDSFPAAVPPGLGAVTGVLTKRAAKEASAQGVLDWLRELERERDADLAEILSQGRF